MQKEQNRVFRIFSLKSPYCASCMENDADFEVNIALFSASYYSIDGCDMSTLWRHPMYGSCSNKSENPVAIPLKMACALGNGRPTGYFCVHFFKKPIDIAFYVM